MNRNTRNPRDKARHAAKQTRTPSQLTNVGMGSANTRRKAPKSRTLDQVVAKIPIDRGEVSLTRRHFIYGAAGVAAIVALGGGAYAFDQIFSEKDTEQVVLNVDASAVTSGNDIEQVESTSCVALVGDFKLDFGTLVWCNDDTIAACLTPGSTGKPLTQVNLLWLSSGNTSTVLAQAVGADDGFEIYDVRANSRGIIWVESDILEGTWRVYTATLNDAGSMGTAVLADTGDNDWEIPSITLVGSYAFWQTLPKSTGSQAASSSLLKKTTAGTSKVETVWESQGRMATPPYGSDKYVVITPRSDSDGSIHYRLTCLNASSGEEVDSMVLPASMKPLEAGWSENGFTFAFDSIYDSTTGIANLGTYAPSKKASGDDYSNVPWFRWARTPSCAPCNCADYLIVKSTSAVCGVDLSTKTYFALDTETGSEDYGDMLASSGSRDSFVTFSNITTKPLQGSSEQYCHVRVWSAL